MGTKTWFNSFPYERDVSMLPQSTSVQRLIAVALGKREKFCLRMTHLLYQQ